MCILLDGKQRCQAGSNSWTVTAAAGGGGTCKMMQGKDKTLTGPLSSDPIRRSKDSLFLTLAVNYPSRKLSWQSLTLCQLTKQKWLEGPADPRSTDLELEPKCSNLLALQFQSYIAPWRNITICPHKTYTKPSWVLFFIRIKDWK